MATRRRLDTELVRRGIVASRERARQAIEAGHVLVGGSVADKASRQVAPDEPIRLVGPAPRFVSRGGDKLEAALSTFGVTVAGRRVIDTGASTGGFTDCVLQRGAAHVVAVDVGYGQLHERLVADPRVTRFDRTNIRHVAPTDVGGAGDLVVSDLSFISLRTVARALVGLVVAGGDLIVLVKPQFEAGRSEAAKGKGIITDPAVWTRVLEEVIAAFGDVGATMMGVMASPITGSDGNVEFLVHLRAPGPGGAPATARPPLPDGLAEADTPADTPADTVAAAISAAVDLRDARTASGGRGRSADDPKEP